jgi:hypothetical protein
MCRRKSAIESSRRLGYEAAWVSVFRRSLLTQTSFGEPGDADRQLLLAFENCLPSDKKLVPEDSILHQNNNQCENMKACKGISIIIKV